MPADSPDAFGAIIKSDTAKWGEVQRHGSGRAWLTVKNLAKDPASIAAFEPN
jgi:hypothetical protein